MRQQSRQTHREQELFDFLHGVCHPQVRIRHWGEHLNEDVQLHGEVGVLGLAPFPQALLLESAHTRASQEKSSETLTGNEIRKHISETSGTIRRADIPFLYIA